MDFIGSILARIDDFRFQFQQRRAMMQPQNKVITYRNPETRKKPVAAFGADVNEAFGLDWASYRVPQPTPLSEPIPLSEHENTHGHVPYSSPAPMPAERGYEDPAISPHPSRSSETTDQQPIKSFRGEMSDKPITLSVEAKKDFQASRSHELTIGDKIALEWNKTETYDFRG